MSAGNVPGTLPSCKRFYQELAAVLVLMFFLA
jgi:hypothetical protein